ncbi:ribonuclease-III-like-domain-containing protein [Chaetomium fimeti]|jgi:large subunit ribosomal protein L15|uniref:Ribonuclease-III-like-domain-containing protein n=1 Tax=Chaetomium fimeti TaxID=1854472 RepID=A0AAE0H8K0_9PEZI|nr:ribonuclease-III-like-domain-containing protein [Chaetomium fimeti]
MALNPSRSAVSATCKVLRRCGSSSQSVVQRLGQPVRQLSTSASRRNEAVETTPEQEKRPRWSYTPERMKGPGFSINVVKDPSRTIWHNNEDPAKLDAMYMRLLGSKGDRMLPDEIKWLAVTHKSFDQGRRGFNTRLAYFGRLIVSLETTRHILVTPAAAEDSPIQDPFNREPFQHSALANVDKLNIKQPMDVASKEKIAKLAIDVGLPEVTRWKPRMPEHLEGSGFIAVLNTSLFAIVGAISLQHGAETAQQVVREKILRRLGA